MPNSRLHSQRSESDERGVAWTARGRTILRPCGMVCNVCMRVRAARSPSLSVATRPDHLLEPLGDGHRAHPRPPWPHRRPRASRPRRASVVWGNTHFLNCSRIVRIVPVEGVYSQLTPKTMESSKKLARVLFHHLLDPKTVENGSVGRQLTCAYPTIFMPNPRV